MALRLITRPEVEPISLVEAKRHLRVDHTDDDLLIGGLIAGSRAHLDGKNGWLGRCLVTQTWDLVLDNFPDGEIEIPLPPLQEVEGVYYLDGDGNEQAIDPNDYYVDDYSEPSWLVPVTAWPSTLDAINATRVRFVCGYPPDSGVSPPDVTGGIPESIKIAMLLHIGSLYHNAEDTVIGQSVARLPFGTEALLRPYRIRLGMA